MDNTSKQNEYDYSDDFLLSTHEGITWCAAYVITSVAIVTGNVLALLVFARNPHFRRKKFWLLINLTVADLLVGGIAVPLDVYTVLPDYFDLWQPGDSFLAAENAAVFFAMFTAFASILSLTMISLERFYATFFTFRYRQLKNRPYVLAFSVIWILAVVPYTCSLLHNLELVSPVAYLYFRSLFAAVLLLITCLSYLSIWIKVKWGATPRNRRAHHRDRKLTVTLFIATTLSLIAWLPMQLLSMVLSADHEITWSTQLILRVDLGVRLLLFANSLVNPILYSMKIRKFKAEIGNIWLNITCRGNSTPIGRNQRYRASAEESMRRRTGSSLSTSSKAK